MPIERKWSGFHRSEENRNVIDASVAISRRISKRLLFNLIKRNYNFHHYRIRQKGTGRTCPRINKIHKLSSVRSLFTHGENVIFWVYYLKCVCVRERANVFDDLLQSILLWCLWKYKRHLRHASEWKKTKNMIHFLYTQSAQFHLRLPGRLNVFAAMRCDLFIYTCFLFHSQFIVSSAASHQKQPLTPFHFVRFLLQIIQTEFNDFIII